MIRPTFAENTVPAKAAEAPQKRVQLFLHRPPAVEEVFIFNPQSSYVIAPLEAVVSV